MNDFKFCYWFLICCLSVSCGYMDKRTEPKASVEDNLSQDNRKKLSLLDYDHLVRSKSMLQSTLSAEYQKMLSAANKALDNGPYTIVHKEHLPPSGDKHDYISLGPYWWPDPAKPDGLPWIRRDGVINPLARGDRADYVIKNKMFHDVRVLGLAYFFSDDKRYAIKALEILDVWFGNQETKMNPNLNFAQGIPGKNTGRGIGIIEFAGIANIINTIEILENSGVMTATTSKNLRRWFSDYLVWLQTSKNGIFEKNTKNNHATWYDVQLVSIMLFLDREKECKQVLDEVMTVRMPLQIAASGAQEHELARTKALSYSVMNLRGFTDLAYMATKVNIDLWNYETDHGASIIRAFEFLKPYAIGTKQWDYEQINSLDKAQKDLQHLFLRAGSLFHISEYCNIGTRNSSYEVTSLIYHCK